MTLVLGIESSCDETAAALVTGDRQILAQAIASQEAEHSPYGGVVPEIAARAHVESLDRIIAAALEDAGVRVIEIWSDMVDRREWDRDAMYRVVTDALDEVTANRD